jgi:hypothetical protein
MVTVICGINGFHVVDLMTEQHSYDTAYFPSHILEPLLLAARRISRRSQTAFSSAEFAP